MALAHCILDKFLGVGCHILIFIINNNAGIIIYGRRQDIILLFKIPMDTRKDFSEICRQFGHAPSKMFASAALE
jgi:hypothetical protein